MLYEDPISTIPLVSTDNDAADTIQNEKMYHEITEAVYSLATTPNTVRIMHIDYMYTFIMLSFIIRMYTCLNII